MNDENVALDLRDGPNDRPCPHGDPACPCQDGDSCHYEAYGDSPAMACAHCDPNDLEAAVEAIQAQLVAAWSMDSPRDLNAALALLAAAREMVESAKTVVEYVELDLLQRFPGKVLSVEGGSWIVASGSRREFREHESLLTEIAHTVCDTWIDDEEKAELLHAIAGCLPASVGWKVGALKELDVDPELFCEWKSGKKTLRFEATKDLET